ncbi:MAG: DNA repair protein RecN [Gammaproteobacteria bacterium]|nr:DNA repair protein RecN [Gammaproteobacteria bacterium]
MLKAITIQDLAVVRQLDVELERGLTVITGETGAGKSILIEALALALGDKADAAMVRAGAERATVSATFDPDAPALRALLEEHGLPLEDECILRRTIAADGRSRAFCNGTPVPLALLKEIGDQLVDIHGQHAHQSLLRRAVQRTLLDEYGKLGGLAARVRAAWQTWQDAHRERAELLAGIGDIANRADFLRFQLDELETLGIARDELAELDQEHRRLAHASRLLGGCTEIAERIFDGERSLFRQIANARTRLRELAALDAALNPLGELFEQAVINLEEAERELDHYRDGLELDPMRLEKVEARLQALHDAARKHHCEPEALPEVFERLNAELAALGSREARVLELEAALAEADAEYRRLATELSAGRATSAQAMGKAISRRMRELGMPHGRFEVGLSAAVDELPTPHGRDEVDFLVTANPDQPARPLRKVASGGELSRISLAIQVETAGISGVPVLVYDEVDSGIGGRTADVVGSHLRALATQRQVLCITHLAQVAAAGHQHLTVGKFVTKGVTGAIVRRVEAEDRVEEIARMLGGERMTERALAHAREMLSG